MQRITISVDDELAQAFERLVERRGYLNRSEAFRDLVRKELDQASLGEGAAKAEKHAKTDKHGKGGRYKPVQARHCVAALSYVYNHHERQLANRLTEIQHARHDVAVAALHVHLDHDNCLETLVLRGPLEDVRACADAIIAQTGVRHGQVHMIPVDLREARHGHGAHSHAHGHLHASPRN
jgi:CopG family nickel-responsive transcriptional regulator